KLTRREDLTVDEASAAMAEVMKGRAATAQIAGLLVGLAMKGERPAEIVGLEQAMACLTPAARAATARERSISRRARRLLSRRVGFASPNTATDPCRA